MEQLVYHGQLLLGPVQLIAAALGGNESSDATSWNRILCIRIRGG
jgi:hypothetical protein